MKAGAAFLLLAFLAGCGTPSGGGSTGQPQNLSRATASAKAHTELAGMYYERSQLGIALGEIATALQADRNYAPAYSVRGLIRMALREYGEAEEDFRQSLKLDRNDSETHNNYGWFLCQQGRESESIPHFMAALKNPLYSTPERAYLNAGLCSAKAGKPGDAEEFLQRALAVRPDFAPALIALADVSFTQGDYLAARRYLARYSEKMDLTAGQLWLALRIARKLEDRNAEARYGMQLRKHFPDAQETKQYMYGE